MQQKLFEINVQYDMESQMESQRQTINELNLAINLLKKEKVKLFFMLITLIARV